MLIIGKFLAAVLIGFLIGFERREKVAGKRTFALLCLGSTIFTTVSVMTFGGGDPMRVIAQIVSGIGFLGLGVIWKYEGKPVGLTTAATVWVTAAIGILVGLGLWVEVVAGTILVVAVLNAPKTTLKKPSKK